ncbi:MAG: membrane protein insertase YidC [Chitinophagaceae bacterium]|nr:membrane protein insertase YidC [Chitinophagaceae bacterium]
MNFDRNTVLGFVLLALLFFGFFWYSRQGELAALKERARVDSITSANKPKQDPATIKIDSVRTDSQQRISSGGSTFANAGNGSENLLVAENDLVKITFTNKGGQPKMVELKKFKQPDSSLVKLASSDFDKIDYPVNAGGKSAHIADLYFENGNKTQNADGSTTVTFTLRSGDSSQSVTHQYVLKPDNYMIDFNLQLNGSDKLLEKNTLNLTWQNKAAKLEKSIEYEKQNSQIGYDYNGEYDYSSLLKYTDKQFDKNLKWLSVKQQFFNTTLIARDDKGFSSGKIEWALPADTQVVVQAIANVHYQVSQGSTATVPMSIYYGPNDYKILKGYKMGMENLVNLGYGIFAFVKYINRWIILPVFDFFTKFFSSYGLIIALLTIFIRLLTSPLMYPGYLTSAKMKILRPELAELKKKYPDQQQYAVEQMKFMREAGVNTFAGCLPSLLQIPIFFALFSFFSSSVALRGKSFLWAEDLSSYDSILNFGFNIPFYGSHVSLFTITAVVTSFLISLYSMNMTPDQSNPVMKYMPYIFPVFLLFIFNRLPSALTWYYTVSNVITLLLQVVIQKYIINHDKLLTQIELNRKKPKTKSKWQERLEQMQEQQKQMKGAQQKNKR